MNKQVWFQQQHMRETAVTRTVVMHAAAADHDTCQPATSAQETVPT